MTRTTLLATSSFAVLLSLAAIGIGAQVDMPRTLMSPGDYESAKRSIEVQTRQAMGRCRDLQGPSRDVCKAEVRAEERVRKADLGAQYHGTVSAAREARAARVKALYDVARAKCGGMSGEDRIECLRDARQSRNKSLDGERLAST